MKPWIAKDFLSLIDSTKINMGKKNDKKKQVYDQTFEEEVRKLNAAQKKAVDTIDGPVLVVAGPGTGKTHILSARIGKILKDTDTDPHNILCLTYTDAGVLAMRERLLQFIGPESHKVHIYTFHSFCNSVIKDNLSFFGMAEMEPISQLERVDLIREIINELEDGHLLRPLKGDGFVFEKKIRNLMDRMKQESWTEELVIKKGEDYIESLKDNPDFLYKINRGNKKKGDLREPLVVAEKAKVAKLIAAAKLYKVYQQKMRERKRYDFADMILWVVDAFKNNGDLLRNYQEQYLYILVDEFQDTNGSQNHVLKMLIDYWNKPNVFVVGDDDQSIFEFQGARVKNITDFYEKHEDIELVVLKENYRSSQEILDAAKTLIEENELRLVNQLEKAKIDKNLKAANPTVAKSKIKPVFYKYPNPLHEDADIVAQIENLRADGVMLSEIAIIYSKHKQARNIISLLNRKGIPYTAKKRVNILETPLVKNLLNFIFYLSKEFEKPHSGESLLFEIMHYRQMGIKPNEIARLTVFQSKDRYEKIKGDRRDEIINWRDLLLHEKRLRGMRFETADQMLRLGKLIDELIIDYANCSLPDLIERLINRTGLIKYLSQHEEKLWLVQVLSTFFDFVRKEAIRNPDLKAKKFLSIINQMKDNNLELGLMKVFYSEDTGVNLITAHSSKGLEFKYVFMINCLADTWEPSRNSGNRGFFFPKTLTYSGTEDAMESARRLFYVAMTRAKEFLQISYSSTDLAGKEKQKARFVDELFLSEKLEENTRKLTDDQIVETQLLLLTHAEKPSLEFPLSKEALKVLLEDYVMSATSLSRFLDCPLSFYFEHVIRIPSMSSEAAAYGSAVHHGLRRLFEKMKADPQHNFPEKEDLVKEFEFEMERQRIYFSKDQYSRRLMLGRQMLPLYYEDRLAAWHKKVELEHNLRNVEVDGVPITGSIDKVEFFEQQKVRVVDYKTSRPQARHVKPATKDHIGGNYWRQLIFYKLLLENHKANQSIVTEGEIDYVEPDPKSKAFKRKKLKFVPEQVEIVRNQIKDSYQKIQNFEFFEGCGKEDCKWCNFTRTHYETNSMRNELMEELDDSN